VERTISTKLINEIFELESHEVEELRLLLMISRELSPEIYMEVKKPLKKIINNTLSHVDDLQKLFDELKVLSHEIK
jgi:hypothetical protein